MDLLGLGFLLPLIPLFAIPLLLVAVAWIDRRRQAARVPRGEARRSRPRA